MGVNQDFYTELMIRTVEEEGLMNAPANLKDSILRRKNLPDIQVIAGKNRLSSRVELLLYSGKICAAIIWVFIFLNLSNLDFSFLSLDGYMPEKRDISITEMVDDKSTDVVDALSTFSNNLFDLGGKIND